MTSPLQPDWPTAQEQEATTFAVQKLHVDTSSSREEGGDQQGERAADVDNPTSESNDPSGGGEEEEEEEEFRYGTVGQASGDASVEPQGEYCVPSSSVRSVRADSCRAPPVHHLERSEDDLALANDVYGQPPESAVCQIAIFEVGSQV